MNKDRIVMDLKKNFKNIYEAFERRIDRSEWKKAVEEPYENYPEDTAKAAAEFVMTHEYMPSSSVRSLLQAVELRNGPSLFSQLYSEKITESLLQRMVRRDPLRYALIPPQLSEDERQALLDAAREADLCLKRSQLYLAEAKISEAENICAPYGGHPDVSLLRARACCLKFDFASAERHLGGIAAAPDVPFEAFELAGDIAMAQKRYSQANAAYRKAKDAPGAVEADMRLSAKAAEAASRSGKDGRKEKVSEAELASMMQDANRCQRGGDLKGAAKIYEEIIAKDYRRFEAYYPLGRILLKRGSTEQADYLAELLMDFDAEKGRAKLLKGMILEAKGRAEDALFYYNSAVREQPEDPEALYHRARLTAALDGDEDESARAEEILSLRHEIRDGTGRTAGKVLFEAESDRQKAIRRTNEQIDGLLRRGRMTEAYYELIKQSAEYPESSLLSCKKAYVLYLMKREGEARNILSGLRTAPGTDDRLAERISDFIYDIDCRIAGEGRTDDIEYDVLPQVYFNTGRLKACGEAIGRIREEKLTPALTALRGRCELAEGRFSEALKDFDAALAEDPELRGIRVLKGMILQSKRDFKGAMEMYEEALQRGEDSAEVSGLKASLLYEQERNAELLVFRSDAEKMPVRSADVDGYAGLVYMERTPHDEKKGVSFLENAMRAGSGNMSFYTAAARAYISETRFHAALSAAESGLCIAPQARELFLLKAEILFLLEKYEAAEMVAGTLLSEDLKAGELHYLLGRIEAKKGNEKNSLKWLKSAADLEPENHRYIYAYADQCFETGDKKSAEEFYTKAIRLEPRDYISLKRRAILREEKGDEDAAISDIRTVLEMRPNDAEAYVILGNIISAYDIEEKAEGPDGAGSDGEGAESGESNTAGGSNGGPDIEEEGQQSGGTDSEDKAGGFGAEGSAAREAEEFAERGAEESAEMDSGKNGGQAGHSPDTQGAPEETDSEDAAQGVFRSPEYYFQKAIRLDPKYRQSYISLAKFKAEAGRYDEALGNIEKAVRLDPNMTDGYMVRGIIHHLRGDNNAAVNDFREVIMRDSKNLRAYSYISKCCNADGRYIEAVEAADRGLAVNGDYVNLYVNRGVALYHMQRYEEAVEAFRKVITNQNSVNTAAVESAYHFRGMAYEKMGNAEKAISDYQKLLRYNPDRRDIKKRVEDLQEQMEEEKPKSRLASFFGRKKNGRR